jgi:Holliday junction resolvase
MFVLGGGLLKFEIQYSDMPNMNYVKGRNHENYVKRKYESKGYACIRSSGSKGPVDVIVVKKGLWCEKAGRHCSNIHAIQCKPKGYKLTKTDREKIQSWAEKTGIDVIVE